MSPNDNVAESQSHRSSIPKAIIVTFIASFISIAVKYIIMIFRFGDNAAKENTPKFEVAMWIFFFAFLLVIRHQLRVVFIDSVYVRAMEKKSEKLVLGLLLIIATMGGLVFSICGIGLYVVSWFMVIYSSLFTSMGIWHKNSARMIDDSSINFLWNTIIVTSIACLQPGQQ